MPHYINPELANINTPLLGKVFSLKIGDDHFYVNAVGMDKALIDFSKTIDHPINVYCHGRIKAIYYDSVRTIDESTIAELKETLSPAAFAETQYECNTTGEML
jgi:hypothetical protein